MRTVTKAITPEVRAILSSCTTDGNVLRLPAGQLPRKEYEAVNKYLEMLGGKWNRKAGGHIFAEDAGPLLSAALDSGEVCDEKQTFQMFFTPPDLAARMVEAAEVCVNDRVLEPSAGSGNILRAIGDGPDKVAVELNPRMVESLTRCGVSGLRIHEADFLECNGELGKFTAVIMNPPFTAGQDIRHIQHALKFLAPGGRLVAICCNGPRQQAELKPLGRWEELPAGTFKSSGTAVATAMLIVKQCPPGGLTEGGK